jgi:hypothetical protein
MTNEDLPASASIKAEEDALRYIGLQADISSEEAFLPP